MATALHASCDRGIAQATPSAPSQVASVARPRMVLATCILASSLAFIDGSVVNVGLPEIGRALSAGGDGLSWVVNAYLLPLGALLLIGGAAGDLYGRRRLLLLGIALFALASAMCALAPNLTWLLLGRGLQGVGAAMLMPSSLAILGATFSGEARGKAVGLWAALGAAAGAAGPLLGGWLIDAVGWRSIFLLNLPIAAGAATLALRSVPPDEQGTHAPLDLAGATLAACGLAAVTWALTVASASGQLTLPAGIALAAGTAMLLAFLLVEKRRGDGAMMPLSLFASPTFVGLTLLTLLLYGALGGLLVLVPYVLIERSGYSAVQAGAALLPLPVVIALTSAQLGRLAGRIGPRLPLSIGPVVVAVGFLLAVRIGSGGNYWTTVFPALLVIALGMAGAVAPLTTAVLASVEPQHTGAASGLNSAVARMGGLVTTALSSAVLAAADTQLMPMFEGAAMLGAATALGAAASAFLLVRNPRPASARVA